MSYQSSQSIVDQIDEIVHDWYPRHVLNRTNWLYRIDSLRPRDIGEMTLLFDMVIMLKAYTIQLLVLGSSVRSIMLDQPDGPYRNNLERTFDIVIELTQLFVSEGYGYFLKYLQIAYYPSSNRITSRSMGPRFPAIQRRSIDQLSNVECREITGFSHEQLKLLLRHLRVPHQLRDERSRRVFTGEEAFLHYFAYNRLGITKLQLSTFYFGGDPRRLTFSIRVFGRYLYTTFYHKIAGDSVLCEHFD